MGRWEGPHVAVPIFTDGDTPSLPFFQANRTFPFQTLGASHLVT